MVQTASADRSNSDLASSLAAAEERYRAENPKSAARAEEAARAMPGGNTRTVTHYTPYPLTIASGRGATITDIDGHLYTDFLGEYTAGLYGHSDPRLVKAVTEAVEAGVGLGGPNRYDAELAQLMCARFPSVDLLRFCNSGTEANLFALSAARAFTGRAKVMAFAGGYHGGVFYFGQAGSPINAPFPFVLSSYNDIDGTVALIEEHAGDLAAIIVEPMMGSAGAIPADREFLEALRERSAAHGVILIFDEVMTSRLGPGGLQGKTGVMPDMTSFGKYLGGGMTFGAFGGRRDIMSMFDPYSPNAVSHPGTFNNNVLSMAAGLVGLRDIFTPDAAEALNARGDRFRDQLGAVIARHDAPMQVTGIGSILALHFQRAPIRRPQDTWPADRETAARRDDLRKLLHLDLIASGIYMARRGFISLSLPLGQPDFDRFAEALDEFLTVRGDLLDAG
ncbi:aspartate aminotransferase family protein [Nisaea sediminum]|uniref:aspartate aminotransferase family protein n=1 Tax=Nisaea sediminum TaxID=2775867 RepID=UPI001866B482|nr:aminotransferase class III-fold pyridoxal phosphate-dependent enzyme [Nisaea sediminum]